jgi:hypothetical protein
MNNEYFESIIKSLHNYIKCLEDEILILRQENADKQISNIKRESNDKPSI